MNRFSSLVQQYAFRDRTTLLSVLSYILVYLTVLGIEWSEGVSDGSWQWKLGILILASILFVISVSRNFSFEKAQKKDQHSSKEKLFLLEKIEILEKSRAEAVDANRAKSKFLAQMSHEIRTLLNSILGFSELLEKSELDVRSKKYVDMISQSGDSLLTLLNDILDLNKIEEGELHLETIPFNFKEVITSTLLPFEYSAKEKNVEFELVFDPEIPTLLMADPYRFRQIVINLVSNAIKFTRHGKISVQFSNQGIKDGRICLRTSVIDTGVGIAPEKQSKIFKPFNQSEESTTREFGGTGLGLTIVAELVKMMEGEIQVESPITYESKRDGGPGSHFYFDVNLAFAQHIGSYPSTDPETKENVELERLPEEVNILVAEDNPVNQLLFQSVLESIGARTKVVGNGQEVIKALQSEEHYDMIFMDIQMPVMDGLQTSRYIRKNLGMSIPIVGATANAFTEDIKLSFQSGMNDVLPKPFRQKDLFDKIMSCGLGEKAKSTEKA